MKNLRVLAKMGLTGAARRKALSQSAVYYSFYMALGATIASLGALLPGIGRQTHATLEQQKWLVPPRAMGFGLGSVLGGLLLAKLDGHRLMGGCAACLAVVCVLMAYISSIWVMLGAQFMYGALAGCSEVVINTLTLQVWREDVGPYMQFLHACFAIGTVVGPVVVGVVLELADGDVAPVFLVFAAFTFGAAIPAPPDTVDPGRRSQGGGVSRQSLCQARFHWRWASNPLPELKHPMQPIAAAAAVSSPCNHSSKCTHGRSQILQGAAARRRCLQRLPLQHDGALRCDSFFWCGGGNWLRDMGESTLTWL